MLVYRPKKVNLPYLYALKAERQSRDGDKRCDLPYIRGDWLEHGVWEKVKEVLSRGSLLVSDFGIFGELGGIYSLASFNAFEEGDGKLTEKDSFSFEMTDMVTGAVDDTGWQGGNRYATRGVG